MFVLSMLHTWRQVTSQSSRTAGTYFRNWSVVSSGTSPAPVISDAMVPPVPIIRTRFMSITLPLYILLYAQKIRKAPDNFVRRFCIGGADQI